MSDPVSEDSRCGRAIPLFLVGVPAPAGKFTRSGELAVREMNHITRWCPRGAYVCAVTCGVRQVLDIAHSIDDIMAGINENARRNLRRSLLSLGFVVAYDGLGPAQQFVAFRFWGESRPDGERCI